MVFRDIPQTKKRKIGRPRTERVQHVIEIEDWHWDYMFGIDDTKFREGPYSDFRHLEMTGKPLLPASIKAPTATVTFFPDYRLLESARISAREPKAVGVISHRGKSYSANLHIPADVLGPLLQMMIAGRYRFVFMEAGGSYRGEALVRHFRLGATMTDEDLS